MGKLGDETNYKKKSFYQLLNTNSIYLREIKKIIKIKSFKAN